VDRTYGHGPVQYSPATANKRFFVTQNQGDTMVVSGHGIFFRLWAIRARSARRRSLTTPWATFPTAGAMKIEWGVV